MSDKVDYCLTGPSNLSSYYLISGTIFFNDTLNEIDKVDGHVSAVTGPSRREGRNSPQISAGNSSPTVGLHSSQQRWVPSIKLQRDANSSQDRNEIIFRTVRSVLNKLTPENFQTLSVSLLNVGISSKVILKGIVILIFDKSIDEPRYSTLYANLCYRLYHEAPNFDPPPSQPINAPYGSTLRPNTFRRLIIAKLQDEFENRNRKLEAFDSKVGPLDANEEEQRLLSKHHMLGNIKFIGELYRLGILHESIMHKCIKQLINKKKKGTADDVAEDLECLSQIMTTCGKRLDHPKAKSLMDQYFERMEVLRRKHNNLPLRIRFMLQDVAELRRNNWTPRRLHQGTGPKTLDQIRQEFEEMYPPSYRSNGQGYGGEQYDTLLRFQTQATRYGADPGHRTMRNYPMMGESNLSQEHHYSGGFTGTSLPAPSNIISDAKNGDNHDFDFFGPTKSKSGGPPAGSPLNPPPARPPFLDQQQLSRPTQQPMKQSPMFNGYPPGGPSTGSVGLARGQETHTAPGGGLKEAGGHVGHKVQHESEKSQNVRNCGPATQRRPPVFTPFNSSKESSTAIPRKGTQAPNTQPSQQHARGAPFAIGPQAHKNATSPRSLAVDPTLAPVPRNRGLSGNRRASPTILQTNIDAIQAPFQHAIDNANQKAALCQKNSGTSLELSKGKKSSLSLADVERISDEIMEKFFEKAKNAEEVGEYVQGLKIRQKHMPILVCRALISSLSKPDDEKKRICRLILYFIEIKSCTKEHVLEGVQSTLDKLSDLEPEIPLIKSTTASLLAHLVADTIVTMSDVAQMLTKGVHFPLFLLTLQHLAKVKGQDWVAKSFKESKVDMLKMMPEASQTKCTMISILEGKQLEFLLPLVHIESKLTNQITENPNPASIYKWIKENVTSDLHSNPAFINVLVFCCLDHVTRTSSLDSEMDQTQNLPKEIKEKERQLLVEIKPVLQKFVHDSSELQLHALYATQGFCFNKSFPKGLLLRLFNAMYEEDVVDEEIYFKWKEDVNDSYPGKGKALFQVNAWLTWLHEAETEDEED